MEKTVRRRSDPLMCQYLWDAITTIRNHKQLPSFDRIRRYMNRTHSMEPDKVEKHLDECTLDNLIIEEPDTHDWYCFECHQSGEVVCCSKCYRVFHSTCLDSTDFPFHPNLFVCPICKKRLYQRSAGRSRLAREELNGLLMFIVSRLKEKLPMNILERVVTSTTQKSNVFISDRGAGQSQGKTEQNGGINLSEPWRAQILLHHQMDLRTMEQKAQDGRYKTLLDFEIDALTIVHNVVIFHGVHSTMADMGRQMLRDCQHDLAELDQCKDCFHYSREKNERYWFCKPCNPPHELVFAKEKGFPYWPAKVLKVENDIYHVRFFGNQHQIADVDKSCIKPITTSLHSIQVKRTSAWIKAYEELKKHQEFLVNGYHEQPQQPQQPHTSTTFQHAFQPPPPHPPPPPPPAPYQQPQYHPFHPHQQYHPQYPQPHHLIHPHQHHWEAVQSSEHQRLVQSGIAAHPHIPFVTTVKKECETEIQVPTPKENALTSVNNGIVPEKKDKEEKRNVASHSEESSTNGGEGKRTSSYAFNEDQGSSISSSSKAKCPKKEPPVPEDVVSSSSQEHRTHSQGVQTSPRLIKMLVEEMGEQGAKKSKNSKDAALKDLADKHEQDKQRAIQMAIKQKEKEMEKAREELENKYKQKISETKRKQWCWTCEAEAIYHCCWNTAYCSIECQQEHWRKEHKKNCRRKR
ncbi:Zinc finger MYND domain-containing protein 11 [Armadillidium vulgare]|nr:Zinc finger MYND domain-containing protein 11 [Armadillidium vulgare]